MSYAKLFSTITESSLWSGSKESRLLFVSMLARADSVGFVEAALTGLSRIANLTMEETAQALRELMAPDPESKSKEADGRRVVEVPRGWCLVNYESYRERRDEESRREYMREYMTQYRKRSVNTGKQSVNKPDSSTSPRKLRKLCKPPLAKAEAEAEAEAEQNANARAREVGLGPPNGDIPIPSRDADRWSYEQTLPWAAGLIDAGCKCGKQNWPTWKALVTTHTSGVVIAASKGVAASKRWPDEVEMAITAARGQETQGAVVARKTRVIG